MTRAVSNFPRLLLPVFLFLSSFLILGQVCVHAQTEDPQENGSFQNILKDVLEEKSNQDDSADTPPPADETPPYSYESEKPSAPEQEIVQKPTHTEQPSDNAPPPTPTSPDESVTAQEIPPPTMPPPTTIIPMVEPPPSFLDLASVKLQTLDKATARTMTFEARVGSTVQFGPIFIKVRACRSPPPEEKKESAAFLQIWENDPKTDEPHWVFSGWMFASSPALSSMDHPIYDVWVVECLPDASTSDQTPEQSPKQEAPIEKNQKTPGAP